MFEERDPQNYWRLGKWRGIPVWLHWSALLWCIWLYMMFWNIRDTLIGSVAMLVLLVVHEFGHVLALRRRKVYIERITLQSFHGETQHGPLKNRADEILVAWSGVLAQAAVLVLTLIAGLYMAGIENEYVWMIAGPVSMVWIRFNVLLMLIALLPIGPFDGRAAWQLIPWLRQKWRKRRRGPPPPKLSAEQLAALEESSKKSAAEILEKLTNKK